jgi:flagellar biosynthesis protein FlhG
MTTNLQKGESIEIKVNSPLYRDTYHSEVLSTDKKTCSISMPTYQGKLILIGAGTPMEINIPNHNLSFSTEVIDRGFTPDPHLIIQLPYNFAENKTNCRIITVTSGKGGVGKTTFTINLALSLAKLGQRVFILDADLGTANVDVLLNLQPRFNLSHLINNEKEIMDIIVEGPGGIHLVPGGSGLQDLADMEEWQFNRLVTSMESLEKYADIILIDTGAGLGKHVINFALAADNLIVITTPEPHAITDAYAIMKVLEEHEYKRTPYLVVNRVESGPEYQEISTRMHRAVSRFLNINMINLGFIPDDYAVPKSNKRLEPFALYNTTTPAAKAVYNIAKNLLNPGKEESATNYKGTANFFSKIKELFSK